MLVLNRCPVESIMLEVEVSEPCPMTVMGMGRLGLMQKSLSRNQGETVINDVGLLKWHRTTSV